ncbi:MAG: hypothetical protein PVF83_03820 [Anaerolineales bacterium]|jgi:hypothetical protein
MSSEKKPSGGREAAVHGASHEHIVAGILMKKYGNVSLVDLPLSSYDIILQRGGGDAPDFIRIQVKTAQKSVPFTGGSRGGIDRSYDPAQHESKIYRYSTHTSDVIIGVHPKEDESYDLYFVPTHFVEIIEQSSISLNKIQLMKNNYEFLDKCKDKKWVLEKMVEMGLIEIHD